MLGWGSFLTVTAGGFIWISLVLLAHVWPALFPGRTFSLSVSTPGSFSRNLPIPNISIPDSIKIATPPDTVFNRALIILVVGTDTSADLENMRTDTILLARVDPVTKSVKLLSIPRDLLIEITAPDGSVYEERANASFGVGAAQDHSIAGGMRQLVGDIERNFGVTTDYWVQVDFRGAEELFDALGGVDVDIPEDLSQYDWYYSDNDRPAVYLSFPPGPQHLNGYEAVAFSRLREFDDDFHRIRRQQIVMEAAMSQAFSKGLLNNIPALWSAYKNAIVTNVETARIPGFGLLARDTQGRLETYSLADPVNGTATVYDVELDNGAQVLGSVPENIEYWITLVLRDPVPEPAPEPSTTASSASASPIPNP